MRIHRPEATVAEICIRIAEISAVKQIAELGFEFHFELFANWKDLEYVQVFAVGGEAPYGIISSRRIAQLERTGIGPCGLDEIVLCSRVEVSASTGHSTCVFHTIGSLLPIEEEASQIIVHEYVQRPTALVAQDARQVPTTKHGACGTLEVFGSWDLPVEGYQEDVRGIIGAHRPLTCIYGVLDVAIDDLVSQGTFGTVIN